MSDSSTAVPPGNCVTHGYHGRVTCPKCSTSVIPPAPLAQTPSAAYPPHARDWHNVRVLRVGDIGGTPVDLKDIVLVYSVGDAQDVLAVYVGDDDLTIRTEYATPLEESAVRAAIRERFT